MHSREPVFGAEAEGLPDAVLGGDDVGKTLADERCTGEGGGVKKSEMVEDLGEEFGGGGGEGTGKGGGCVRWGLGWGDRDGSEGGE